ncbi:helix-turn-helix domain-containing protein [Rhodobacterales bacterium LSUCC0031]|nr:helix-turn-helix domain-containing protein [Rhodobacterales bacterium LSUCC0031]
MQGVSLTSEQIRAARAVTGLSIRSLAEMSGISVSSIKRYEAATGVPNASKGHLNVLKEVYEAHGIQFVGTPDDDPGIRVTTPSL